MLKLLSAALLISTAALAGSGENGKDIYLQNCANCHSTNMSGGLGKDFNLVSYTRTKEAVVRYITDPGSTYREFGYSANAMPKLPLNEADINAVADYIDGLQPFKSWMKPGKTE